jgi:catechol 2,3-dioxygenase-like lactoylglutathione lyase family enzyme
VFDSFDHVIVAVSDLDSAVADYQRLLGLEMSWRGSHPGGGTANALFRLDNTYVELLAPQSAGPDAELLQFWLDVRGEGPLGFAFGTDDLAAVHDELAKRGLEPGPIEPGQGRDSRSAVERIWRTSRLPPAATRGIFTQVIEHISDASLLPRAQPVDPTRPGASVHALDHAVIRSPDADAARALYGDGLGLRLALDRSFEQWGMRLLFFRVGGVTVEVACALEGAERPDAVAGEIDEQNPAEDRFWGLCFRVRDLDAAAQRLSGSGVEVSNVRDGRKPGTRVATVQSCTHGVATLLLEREDESQ